MGYCQQLAAPPAETLDQSNQAQAPDSDDELGAPDNLEQDSAEPKAEPDKKLDKNTEDDDDPSEKQPAESKRKRPSSRNDKFSKRSPELRKTFEPIVGSVAASTVKIVSGRRQISLGLIVDNEGLILTKASELKGDLTCKLMDGRQVPAQVFGVHADTDLAMLKIEIDGISAVQWNEGPAPVVGQWLVTPNGRESKMDIGVVSVNTREIPASKPFIGITMVNIDDRDGVRINLVVPQSPADDSDLMINDIITHIDDVQIIDVDGLRDTLGQYDPQDRVIITVIRAGKDEKINLTLAERDKISPANDRSNQQNSMGSRLSRRRKNFPSAFQHDSALTSTTCGGPVVDLSGRVVGINIARAGRVSSLSLPTQVILPIIELLKTGELAPAIANQARIAEIDQELADIVVKIKDLPRKQRSLDSKYNIENAKRDELKRILDDVQNRLKVIELKSKTFKKELDSVNKDLKNIEKTKQRLEADRKRLATGVR